MTARSFDLVIFDNDGVLVDSEPHANTILATLLTEAGWETSYEESVSRFMGGSLARVRAAAEQQLGRPLPGDFEQRYHAQLFERFRTDLKAIPGVVRALDRITVPACVASSGSPERIRRALEATGLLERFEGKTFSAEEVERGKPAPDLFLHAAEKMDARPDRCAVIEDSPIGIDAANAAGMTSFGYAGMETPERLRHATGGVFTDMRELPALLSRSR